ncbi:MAG: HAMP domain-containing protein, partial [Gammaproteobacteria bacterium]
MLPVLFDRRALTASLFALGMMVVAFVLGFIWLQWRIMSVHDRELFQSLERAIILTTRMDNAEDRAALAISLRISNETIPDKRYFVLLDPNGNAIVGDLAKVPASEQALEADSAAYRVPKGDGLDTYVRSARLADGSIFIVTQPDTARFEIAKALGRVAVGIIILVILIGLGTGFVLNRYILGYVRGLADTARQIMRGQMAARAPAQQRLDAMGALTMTFNEMLDQNEALVTGMRTVTESLAHDLRTPLMRMRRSLAAARAADSEAVREQLLNEAEADV